MPPGPSQELLVHEMDLRAHPGAERGFVVVRTGPEGKSARCYLQKGSILSPRDAAARMLGDDDAWEAGMLGSESPSLLR